MPPLLHEALYRSRMDGKHPTLQHPQLYESAVAKREICPLNQLPRIPHEFFINYYCLFRQGNHQNNL